MKYKMIPVEKFWKARAKGKYPESKTLVLMQKDGELVQEFAYVMNGFFDCHRQGCIFNQESIIFVLVNIS